MNRRIFWGLCSAILAIGFFARIYGFPSIPAGFNQDEALGSYETWSLLTTGKDMRGIARPVFLDGWGMGANAGGTYLAMPLMAVFGPTTLPLRALNLLFGIAGLFALFLLLRQTHDELTVLIGLFLLAIAPWHIMGSRWGHGSYLYPNLFIAALYFIHRGLSRPVLLIPAALLCGVAVHLDAAPAFFFFIFFILFAVSYRTELRKHASLVIAAAAIFTVMALPVILFMLKNTVSLSIPFLERLSPLAITTASAPRARELLEAGSSMGYLKLLWNNLLVIAGQYDGLPYNAIKGIGTIYMVSIPFFLMGLGRALKDPATRAAHRIYLLWLAAAATELLIIPVNINRISIIWPVMVIFTASGIGIVVRRFHDISDAVLAAVIALYLACFQIFFATYLYSFSRNIPSFRKDLETAMPYIVQETTGPVRISRSIEYPYLLFFGRYDPDRYQSLPGTPSQKAGGFDRFTFVDPRQEAREPAEAIYLFGADELAYLRARGLEVETIKDFGSYSAVNMGSGLAKRQKNNKLIQNN